MRKVPILDRVAIMLLLFVFFLVLIGYMLTSTMRVKEEKFRLMKDSLEVEYYKKQLESYPYDHSEIKDSIK